MAMTPEGRVKRKISELLKSYGSDVWWYMPVQTGYGKSVVDYLGCVMGRFFAIEAKRPGGATTPRQEATLAEILQAGGDAFVVDDEVSLAALKNFLDVRIGK